eukprot:8224693-Pyramimonas_sp.AAC.1
MVLTRLLGCLLIITCLIWQNPVAAPPDTGSTVVHDFASWLDWNPDVESEAFQEINYTDTPQAGFEGTSDAQRASGGETAGRNESRPLTKSLR